MQTFFRDAEKLYDDAGFTKIAQQGLVMKEIQTDQKLSDFDLIRCENTFKAVEMSCLDYERNQKFHIMGGSS